MWKIEKLVSKGDYNYCVVSPSHPKETTTGYVLHHRVVVENDLGRLLNPDEVVHHINGDKKDNRLENLQVISKSEHSRIHGLEHGHSMVKLKCPSCSIIFDIRKNQSFMSKPNTKWTSCSNSCRGKFSRKIQLHGITAEVEAAISGNLVMEFNSNDNPEETETNQDP